MTEFAAKIGIKIEPWQERVFAREIALYGEVVTEVVHYDEGPDTIVIHERA